MYTPMYTGVFLDLLGGKVGNIWVVGGVASEVYGYIVELAALARLGRLSKPRLARAHVLMGLLREAGFLPSEISELAGSRGGGDARRRWGVDAVRRYGVWSGVADMSRRDAVIGVVAGLVAEGYNLQDVALCTTVKKRLDKADITFGESLNIGLAVLSAKASVQDLSDFSVEVRESHQTLKELEARKKLADDLDGLGLSRDVQLDILGWAKGFGGEKLKKFLAEYPSFNSLIQSQNKLVDKLRSEIPRLEGEISVLEGRRANLQDVINSNEKLFATVIILIRQGWNPAYLDMIMMLTEKYGDPWKAYHVLEDWGKANEKQTRSMKALMNVKIPDGKVRLDIKKLTGLKEADGRKLVFAPEYVKQSIIDNLEAMLEEVRGRKDIHVEGKAILEFFIPNMIAQLREKPWVRNAERDSALSKR